MVRRHVKNIFGGIGSRSGMQTPVAGSTEYLVAWDQSARSSVARTVTLAPSVFTCAGSFTYGLPSVSNLMSISGSAVVGWICGGMLDRYAPAGAAADGAVHYPEAAYLRILCVIAVLALVGLLHLLWIPETRGRHIYVPPESRTPTA